MRSLILAIAVLGAGYAMQPATAQAGGNAPFCLQGRDTTGGIGDCSYPTYQACQATASGTFAGCYQNPYYAYDAAPVDRPRGRLRRSYYQPY
jgi:hypothetical protein